MNTEKDTPTEPLSDPSSSDASRVRMGAIIMSLSVICFTGNTLFLKYLGSIRSVDPYVALLFRAVVGAMIVLAFFRGRRPLEIIPIFRNKGLIARGISGVIGTVAYYVTIQSLGSGKSTLICNTYVLFAAIIASFALGEKLSRRRFVWMALAFVGISLLLGNGKSGAEPGSGIITSPQLIGLIGAISAAVSVVLVRNLTLRYSNGTIFMAQCLWVLIAVAPIACRKMAGIEYSDIALLSLSAAMAAFGQLMMNEGFRRLTVATGASIQMLWPVLTAAGGFFFFGETFTPIQIVGAALILIGVWRVTIRKKD